MDLWIAHIGECEGCGEGSAVTHDIKRGDRIKCPHCGTITKVKAVRMSCKPLAKRLLRRVW